MCQCDECVHACVSVQGAIERANARGVVYLAEREARLRTTVKEVPMSYEAEGETKASICAPSRIENREPRLPQPGGASSNSLLLAKPVQLAGVIQSALHNQTPPPRLFFLSSLGLAKLVDQLCAVTSSEACFLLNLRNHRTSFICVCDIISFQGNGKNRHKCESYVSYF